MNFQMCKMNSEKSEEPEIKWPTSQKKTREFQKSICFTDYTKAFDHVDQNKLWKILEVIGMPDHLTNLLGNLYAVQETTVRTGHGTMDWFKEVGRTSRLYIFTLLI